MLPLFKFYTGRWRVTVLIASIHTPVTLASSVYLDVYHHIHYKYAMRFTRSTSSDIWFLLCIFWNFYAIFDTFFIESKYFFTFDLFEETAFFFKRRLLYL